MEHQISIFEILDEPLSWFEENLLHGSGFVDGKKRLREAAIKLNNKDFAAFCKKEYGIGGWSIENGWLWHDSHGLHLENKERTHKETYTWTQVAEGIKKLVAKDKY